MLTFQVFKEASSESIDMIAPENGFQRKKIIPASYIMDLKGELFYVI